MNGGMDTARMVNSIIGDEKMAQLLAGLPDEFFKVHPETRARAWSEMLMASYGGDVEAAELARVGAGVLYNHNTR